MKITKDLIYLVVIIILISIVGINRCSDDTTTKTTTTVETKVDSTVVDSLKKEIQYLKALPPDTVYKEIEVPEPEETIQQDGTKVNTYNSTYRDSLISARWTLNIAGELMSQDFQYVPKALPRTKEIVTRYVTQYRTRQVTTTTVKQPGGFISIGGKVGVSPESLLYEVEVEYHAKDGYTYQYSHIPYLKAHLVGVSIPIRFKKIF